LRIWAVAAGEPVFGASPDSERCEAGRAERSSVVMLLCIPSFLVLGNALAALAGLAEKLKSLVVE
jgi:hypothetical protein